MSNRWNILALLFCVRVTMAFQYQAVAALSPFVMNNYGIGLADIGLLIGLYLSPGILIAMPGAAIGQRFGDKETVSFGLLLMFAGGLIVALIPTWEAQLAGRVFAGIGGVILNVLMSKMITDWFAGHKLATAMGIFVNSWPVGIAGALLVLPYLAENVGLSMTMLMISGFIGIGLVLMLTFYRSPNISSSSTSIQSSRMGKTTLICVLLSAAIWGLYNSALSMIFAFGPAMLVERGWSVSTASSTTSIVLWLVAVSVPLGGVIADRLQRRDHVLIYGTLAFAILLTVTPYIQQTLLLFIAIGVVAGLAAGPIMSLPADVLRPNNRTHGMGLFFSLYYVAIFVSPIIAGHMSEAVGTAEIAFTFGGGMLLLNLPLFVAFKYFARRASRDIVVA